MCHLHTFLLHYISIFTVLLAMKIFDHNISNFLHRTFWVCYFLISSAFCIGKIEIKTIVLSFLILVMLFASKLLHQSHMTNVKCPYETFFKCHFFPLKKLWTKKCILWIDLLADKLSILYVQQTELQCVSLRRVGF